MNPIPILLLLGLFVQLSLAGETNALSLSQTNALDPDALRALNKNRSASQDAFHLNTFAHDTNFMIRPGLIADRLNRTVKVATETTSLTPGTPVEFALVAENSGKDYEALAVSFATPSDLHAALQFIGIPPGKPVNPGAMRFWPRGEPVDITLTYPETNVSPNATRTMPITQFLGDTRTRQAIPSKPFLFTGSEWVPSPGPSSSTALVYAADVFSPNGIISTYNDSSVVLDIPYQAVQNEVYTFLVPNPEFPLPANSFATVTFSPHHKNSHIQVTDITLLVGPGSGTSTHWAVSLGKSTEQGEDLSSLTNHLRELSSGDHDLYVTLVPDDTLTLDVMHRFASFIETLDDRGFIRVEPPPPAHPYFKTFLPDEKHRKRANRPVQPWELHLFSAGTSAAGELVYVEEQWTNDGRPSTYKETRYPVGSPDLLPSLLTKHDAPAVVLIFAHPDTTYGTLRRFTTPLLARKMIVYVFTSTPQPKISLSESSK